MNTDRSWTHKTLLVGMLMLASMQNAFAANTTGDMLAGASGEVTHPLGVFWVAIAFLTGVGFIISGLMKLKEAADSRGDKGALRDAGYRIFGGTLLVGLISFVNSGSESLYGTDPSMNLNGGVGGVTDCLSNNGGLTCVSQNIASNLVPIFTHVAFKMFFLIGAFMILHSLYSLAKSHSSGRLELPKGWAARMVIGFLILQTPTLMGLFAATFGITSSTITSTGYESSSQLLTYTAPGNISQLVKYQAMIGNIFIILVMFGVMFVWRGINLLRAYAEGDNRTFGAGIVHIVGGVLLANAKFTTCIILMTVIGNGAGFCP